MIPMPSVGVLELRQPVHVSQPFIANPTPHHLVKNFHARTLVDSSRRTGTRSSLLALSLFTYFIHTTTPEHTLSPLFAPNTRHLAMPSPCHPHPLLQRFKPTFVDSSRRTGTRSSLLALSLFWLPSSTT
jgi:hypothetical protein